jgi:hypothetical protein
MERAARWTRTQLTPAPDGAVVLTLHVRRWTWLRHRDVVIHVTIPGDDASVMQAQLERILNKGWAKNSAEQQARYRGAVN